MPIPPVVNLVYCNTDFTQSKTRQQQPLCLAVLWHMVVVLFCHYYPVRYAQERVKRLSPSIYIFVGVCVCVCVCVCVVEKHGCLLSYRSKIATKWLSTARLYNSYSSKDA